MEMIVWIAAMVVFGVVEAVTVGLVSIWFVLGREARVTEAIDNTVPSGAVYVDGKTWSARSESGETLPEGTLVRTVRMEGVKLFVERL